MPVTVFFTRLIWFGVVFAVLLAPALANDLAPAEAPAPSLVAQEEPSIAPDAPAPDVANASTPAFQVRPYIAEYALSFRGFDAGLMTIILEKKGDLWDRQAIVQSTGLAQLFFDVIFESSQFKTDGANNVVPVAYYAYENKEDGRWVKNQYSEDGTRVSAQLFRLKKDSEEDLVEEEHVSELGAFLDEAVWPFQIARDYRNDQLPKEYKIAGYAGMKKYYVEVIGEEDCRVGNQTLRCVVLNRINVVEPEKTLSTWLSPSLNLLPVRFSGYKKDTEIFRVELMIASLN